MGKESITFLCLFVVLILISSSCHPRHVSDIRPNMTKEEVVSSWGRTDLITYKTTNGITLETWEYHFAGSDSICQITFIQDRVTTNPQCRRPTVEERYYSQSERQFYPEPYYYPYPYLFYYYPYPYYFGGYYRYYRHHYYPRHYPHHYPHHPYRR
jgi:hypothetical protein